jgi:hypothetical protein
MKSNRDVFLEQREFEHFNEEQQLFIDYKDRNKEINTELLEALQAYDEVLIFKREAGKNSQQHIDACNHFNNLRMKAIAKAIGEKAGNK